MSSIYEAYDLPIDNLTGFYRRINKPVTYPDGMTLTLGVVYWGEEKHLEQIEKSIPRLLERGLSRFSEAYQAIRTPGRIKKVEEEAVISKGVLRILKHDFEQWLPAAVGLEKIGWFQTNPDYLEPFLRTGLTDQLEVITAGQTPGQREELAQKTGLERITIDEIVKMCDFYRTGKNLDHIRAKIYYDMGMDTWQKWAGATSEAIIDRFK
jgi:hypothetical protein